jgi:PKD repeat protein
LEQQNRKVPAASRALRKAVCVLVAAAQVTGCAKSPDSIDAKYVSPQQYQNWTCDQLAEEKIRLTREVDRVAGLQRENANADTAMMAVGLIILWPALLGLAATRDRKDELGRLKGEYEAVDASLKTKACTLAPPTSTVASAAPTPVDAAATASVAGTYKGTGKTDSWCLAPTLNVTVTGSTIEGQLSEVGGKPTSSVKGALYPNGIISMEFKGSDDKYFTGKADGTLKNDTLSIAFRSKAATACNMQFDLKKN